jgi:anion-transporting  ArsA/GET3 family ATPase
VSDPTRAQAELRSVVRECELVVCVGSGGVGKTTVAAAIGIQAALEGRRAAVVTIDPARRLANSLGLEALGNEEKQIPEHKFTQQGLEPEGTLHAMMLDTRTTFDDLIRKVSPDDAARDRILNNLVYRHLSDTLSASHDYMASEKLFDLHNSGLYDLVVLDTPPMKNAIDFLEASGRLSRFLDDKIVSWFLKPHRADEVSALLRDGKKTRFVIVCTPQSTSMEEARYFHSQLKSRRMPGRMFIVNQVGRYSGVQRDEQSGRYLVEHDRAWLTERLKGLAPARKLRSFVDRLESHFDRSVAMSEDDRAAIDGLRAYAGRKATVATVPRMVEDVYDMPGLLAIDRHLFGELREPETE